MAEMKSRSQMRRGLTKFSAVLLFVATAALFLGQPRDAHSTGFGTVTGTVTAGGVAAAGWMVYASSDQGTQPNVPAAGYTNAQGVYTLPNVPAGTWDVVAIRQVPSFARHVVTFVVVTDSQTTVANVTVGLRVATGTVSPAVEDLPVVCCAAGSIVSATTTNSSGAFTIELPFAACSLVAIAHEEQYANSVYAISSTSGDIGLGTWTLSTVAGAIEGVVDFPQGSTPDEPAEGMEIEAFRVINGVYLLFGRGVTASNGFYRIPNLRPGTYQVRSTNRGYYNWEWPTAEGELPAHQELVIQGFADEGITVASTTVTHDKSLEWSGGLRITLVDGSSAPVGNATVSLERTGFVSAALWQLMEGDPNDDKNLYLAPGPVAPGSWTIRVQRTGESDYTQSVTIVSGELKLLAVALP
ncbi:MAG: hypothetical protein ACKN9R_00810 [Candidatus Limnocylindrus sp.]